MRKLADERGLYLHVMPGGSKLWRLRFTLQGRESTVSLGQYPDVSLRMARDRREDARRLIAQGISPADERRAARDAREHTFGAVAKEWIEKRSPTWMPGTLRGKLSVLKALRKLDDIPVSSMTADHVRRMLRLIEGRGALDRVLKARQIVSSVLRFGKAAGYGSTDVTVDIVDAFERKREEHRATVSSPEDLADLLRKIWAHPGRPEVCHAMRLLPLVFLRAKELRGAQWSEIHWDRAEWIVPDVRMTKTGRHHIVPLAPQAIEILASIRSITGEGRLVFPGLKSEDTPISESGMQSAIYRTGYSGKQTLHGFRGLASTTLNEAGWNRDWIEMQLSHLDGSVRGAYNSAQYIEQRHRMMRAWATYLDDLRAGRSAKDALAALRAASQFSTS